MSFPVKTVICTRDSHDCCELLVESRVFVEKRLLFLQSRFFKVLFLKSGLNNKMNVLLFPCTFVTLTFIISHYFAIIYSIVVVFCLRLAGIFLNYSYKLYSYKKSVYVNVKYVSSKHGRTGLCMPKASIL